MQTNVEERTEVDTSTGDHDKFRHYVSQKKWTEAMLTGDPVVAICGKVWVPTTTNEKYAVCPSCAEIYKNLKFKDD